MWKRIFSSPWCVAVAALLGVLLSLPSLSNGLISDDFFHWDILTGRINNAHPGSPFGLFSFADGNPAHIHEFMEKGVFPWWTADKLRLSFWRPLAELTHWLDYRLWPDSPMLMHAHNLVWYGALIIILGVWFRTVDGNKVRANIATLIYAVSALHSTAIGWIANRNALIAAFLSLATLILFHRARHSTSVSGTRSAAFYVLSFITFALSLLAGESSIAVAAYLFAYSLLLDKSHRLMPRMLGLLPFACIALIWSHYYSLLGYGSYASGVYIDPATEVARFLPIAALRLPVLLFAQIFGVPSSLYSPMLNLSAQLVYCLVAIAAILVFLSALRAVNLLRDAQVQFYALGMVLAVVPVCATATDDRLLTLVGFGASGLLAAFFYAAFEQFKKLRGGRGIAIKVLAGYLVFLHLVVMPISLPIGVGSMKRAAPYIEYSAISLSEQKITSDTRVVIINPPLPSHLAYLPFVRDQHGLTNPRSAMALTSGLKPFSLHIIDNNTLQITAPEGFIVDNLFRDPKLGFKPGTQIDLGSVKVTLLMVMPDGQPEVVQFQFANSLQDPNLQFYIWDKVGYREFRLPGKNKQVDFKAFDFGNPNRETLVE